MCMENKIKELIEQHIIRREEAIYEANELYQELYMGGDSYDIDFDVAENEEKYFMLQEEVRLRKVFIDELTNLI